MSRTNEEKETQRLDNLQISRKETVTIISSPGNTLLSCNCLSGIHCMTSVKGSSQEFVSFGSSSLSASCDGGSLASAVNRNRHRNNGTNLILCALLWLVFSQDVTSLRRRRRRRTVRQVEEQHVTKVFKNSQRAQELFCTLLMFVCDVDPRRIRNATRLKTTGATLFY